MCPKTPPVTMVGQKSQAYLCQTFQFGNVPSKEVDLFFWSDTLSSEPPQRSGGQTLLAKLGEVNPSFERETIEMEKNRWPVNR
jgi:hypothetical protein